MDAAGQFRAQRPRHVISLSRRDEPLANQGGKDRVLLTLPLQPRGRRRLGVGQAEHHPLLDIRADPPAREGRQVMR